MHHSPFFLSSIDLDNPNVDVNALEDNADSSDTESGVIYYDFNENTQAIDNIDIIDEIIISKSTHCSDEIIEKDNSIDCDLFLHPYSDIKTDPFCYPLIRVFREAAHVVKIVKIWRLIAMH